MSVEIDFIDWLTKQQPPRASAGSLTAGVGDDMAGVRLGTDTVWVSSDMLLDGVHFESARHGFRAIGRKAAACSLSDCAAMAVEPVGLTASIALPKGATTEDAKALYLGLRGAADAFDCPVMGGDTTVWPHPLAIDVTALGRPFPGIAPVRRNGACVGDTLYVTGPLGGSLQGRHMTFSPRVREARLLAESLGKHLHAMMDISDGLSLDLHRMCIASGVGAELEERLLERVLSEAAKTASERDGRSALDHALSDGEDFELLISCAQSDASVPGVALFPVGVITERGYTLVKQDGETVILEPKGFEHDA